MNPAEKITSSESPGECSSAKNSTLTLIGEEFSSMECINQVVIEDAAAAMETEGDAPTRNQPTAEAAKTQGRTFANNHGCVQHNPVENMSEMHVEDSSVLASKDGIDAHGEQEGKEESMSMDAAEEASWQGMDGSHKEGEFQFFLLVAPCPKTIKASVSHIAAHRKPKTISVKDIHQLKLPKKAKPFLSDYACWRLCFQSSSSTESIHLTVMFPKPTVLTIPIPGSKEVMMHRSFYLRSRKLQVGMLHKPEHEGRGNFKLALDTVLVLLNNPVIASDCFAEYAYHNRVMHSLPLTIDDVSKMTYEWLHWIHQEFKDMKSSKMGLWAAKMVLVIISQIQLLRHLQQKDRFLESMWGHYVELLYAFSEALAQLESLHSLPLSASSYLQQVVNDLVSFTPASQWSICLDAFCKVDPRHSFLKHWTTRQGDITMDKQQCERDFKDAISQVLRFAEAFPNKTFKQEAIEAAILAAPTGTTFFKSLHELLSSNLLPKDATEEEVESGFSSEYGKKLVHRFKGLIEVETPKDMAKLILEELKIGDTVMATSLRILTTIFLRLQIVAHHNQSKSSTGDSDLASWDHLIPIWACPHIFTIPLLSDETTLMYDLASKGPLEISAHAITEFVKKLEAAVGTHGKGGVSVENFRTWLRKVCARAADAVKGNNRGVPLTPYSLYSKVASLFERGLQSSGFLASNLDEIVCQLLRQRCGLQEVLQDAKKMSVFDCSVIAQQYHLFAKDVLCEHLREVRQDHDVKEPSCKAEELLKWLCTTANEGIFLDGWIQDALCISLLDALIDTSADTSFACDGELVESSFKVFLLQVEFLPASDVRQNTFYISVVTEWTKLQEALEDGSMPVETVRKLAAHPRSSWERICEVHKFQSHALRAAAEDVFLYENTLLKGYQMLLDYAGVAKGLGLSSDVIEEARLWLERRVKEYKHFTLIEIRDLDHWPLDGSDQIFKDMLILEESKLLRILFEYKTAQAGTQDSGGRIVDEQDTDDDDVDNCNVSMLWKSLIVAMKVSLECYQEEWRNLSHPSYPVQRLNDLLHGLTQSDIALEGSLVKRFFIYGQERVPSNFQRILAALAAWINLQEKRSLLTPLQEVERMLSIVSDDDKITDTLQSVCNSCKSGSLGDFIAIYNNNVKVIDYFTIKEAIVVKQLAESEQLIKFLKENSDDDLRLLTDAIEEQAEDALVDEATVSDLIHIDKVLRPLLKSTRLRLADMKAALQLEIKDLDAAEVQLSSKLGFCNSNIHRIRHFVASLADRSSVLKDNMHTILQSGVYTFAVTTTHLRGYTQDACTFSLRTDLSSGCSSTQNSRQHFSLSDLRDLRSRARMLLSRRRTKHDSWTQESRLLSEDRLDNVQALEEFVKHVDLAEALYDQVSMIHGSGHLLFDSFEWSGSGRDCLQDKVQWVNEQIACWNAALQRARSHFNCLNFFKGVELRLIHHCFSSNASLQQIQLCYELLDWAKPGLNRDLVKKNSESCICSRVRGKASKSNMEVNESRLYACLQSLSTIVTRLFTSVPIKAEVPLGTSVQESSFSTEIDGHNDLVRLISVEEQHCEFNVVVEIFQRNKSHLRKMNNNMLLCSSATSWEEVHLLILRFLALNRTDDGSHVFVIAFIEKLSFECQLQLMTELQQVAKISLQQKSMHKLALVCWTGSQALQGISHHLKVPIQFMNGCAADTMRQLLPGDCEEIVVVTSELSGMGKSTSIKAQHSNVTITISGDISVETLILKLRGLKISNGSSLHIDITAETGYEDLNRHLFELLILGALKSSDVGVCRLCTNKVHVELANTLGNCLEINLPVCSWLAQQHLVWDLDSLNISDDLESDEQLVCLYLDALDTNQLDSKDIVTNGAYMNVRALSEGRCKDLLFRYFIKDSSEMSNSVLTGFLKTLAYQLRKLGATDFYTVETLCWILRAGSSGNFRSNLVASLLQAAKELSLRSVKAWLHGEQQQVRKKDLSTRMHERMSSLLGWSKSNHIMIFFDLYGPFTVLYRNKELIPQAIKTIMSIQAEVIGTQLLDYATLSSVELWRLLSPILGQDVPTFPPRYALTPDNFLKMALISLRINTRVPVIIMGETGCGKTSLLRALATCSNASFSCLTLHAGSTEQDIETFIDEAGACATSRNAQVWAFLDEINACHHLGLLNGLLCHHTMHGEKLPLNLVVLAACNPYRLQDCGNGTVGLRSDKVNLSRNQVMTYKVQPLPEAMLDYVWDYGILSDSDERTYISSMVGSRSTDIIDVLSNSQKFMRKHMGLSSVSLRDIQRWISLFDWFQVDMSLRFKLKGKLGSKNIEGRSKILACSLCYHCRLPTKELRKLYREMCCTFLRFKSESGRAFKMYKHEQISEVKYLKILQEEELDILERMEIPCGIAKNSALLENVFVVLVCILNFLPVFVVGKPGSGKTLALQIIYSTLRGVDSKDEYFRQLPRILMLSYQGSQNSTSEGILKVFDKAKRYVQSNRERDILVMLVLDEIGLAETSCHNPLKVLHPLLEPEVQEVAVVGISNWSLDAAKMNRGIHLSQSDPEEEDLYETGVAILESYKGIDILLPREKLRGLASAYYNYNARQSRSDFHGLRDFYSLIKSLRLCNTVLSYNQLAHSLWRNFGGGSVADLQTFFLDVEALTGLKGLTSHRPPVMSLIKGNLQDPEARHLLLITKGDSASGILQHMLQQEEDFAVIRGSTYKDDKNEEYCYLLLGEIILHMEMGRCILLENADQIWSSLYDMLNQHYTIVGGRKNCRIALGVYSNPMCYVHDKFRCIVVVNHEQIPLMDPPFLNRFEKQTLTYESILDDSQRGAVESIKAWVHELATKSHCAGSDSPSEIQLFAGFFEDSVPSLVLLHWDMLNPDVSMDSSELFQRCKIDLLQTAYIDAIARAHLSGRSEMEESDKWTELFLSWRANQCLDESIKLHISNHEEWTDSIGIRLIVTTCTPLQWSIQRDIENTATSSGIKVCCMRLGDFTCEKQLQAHIHKFWRDEHVNMLVLQADDVVDRDHISLAKFHMDKARKAVLEARIIVKKHVLIIIHVRQGKARISRFSFLCGWKQLTINHLQREPIDLRIYLEQSIPEIIDHEAMPIKHMMARVLTWSYLCIKYVDKSIHASYPQEMVQLICQDELLCTSLKQKAVAWILARKERLWQLAVLNNQKLLSTSTSVHDAFVQYLEERLREALARLIYLIEKTSSLKSYFSYGIDKQQEWRRNMLETLDCDTAPAPCYPEGYVLKAPLDLHIPFSSLYAALLDKALKLPYLESLSRKTGLDLHSAANYLDESSSCIKKDVDASLTPPLSIINDSIHSDLDGYVADFSKIYIIEQLEMSHFHCQAFEWVLRENLGSGIQHASDVHLLLWTKEEELKAQVSLALLCLSAQEIKQEVCALKAGRSANRNFKEELATRCCFSLMPTVNFLNEVGGIEAWFHKLKALLKLLSPVASVDLVYLLQTMHDFALFVILPLHLNGEHLYSLANWFKQKTEEVCIPAIVEKVIAFLPDLYTLDHEHACKCWINFFCSVLKRILNLPSFSMHDISKMLCILVTSPSPSCMMGHVMVQLLNSLFCSEAGAPLERTDIFRALVSDSGEDLFNKDWCSEVNTTSSQILSDHLYYNMRETMTLMLMSRDHSSEWDHVAFDKCLCLALHTCEDGPPFSLKQNVALTLMKAFLFSTASLINQMYRKGALESNKGNCQSLWVPSSISMVSRVSPSLRQAIQVFFMKILHWEFGLSADDLANALKYCENDESPFFPLACLLDSPLLRNARNRLGFNPFTGSSNLYMTAEMWLRKSLAGSREAGCTFYRMKDEIELDHFLRSADQGEQAAFVAAIASNLFVMKSGEPLSAAEWVILEQVKGKLTKLNNWDSLVKQSLQHVTAKTPGGIWYGSEHSSGNSLRSRCLILNILVTVLALPARSPLQGYSRLDPAHLTGGCILTQLDNILQNVAGMGKVREFVCKCGYIYIIGECTQPNQVGSCPQCHNPIGGMQHTLVAGNSALRDPNSRRVMESSLAGKAAFAVRIQPLSYRLLRVLVHYCFLIGITNGGNTARLASVCEELPTGCQNLAHELTKLIEADMALLDKLLACQREFTYHFIHSVLEKLPKLSHEGPLVTSQQRDQWEIAFAKIIQNEPAYEAVSNYLRSKRTEGLNDLLQERVACPPDALQSYFRITRAPCLSHYETMFIQNKERAAKFPCIAAVLAHAKHLSTLSSLMPIVDFSAALHQVLGHKITRQAAAMTTIQEILCKNCYLEEKFEAFESCWNSVRLYVKGYECRQFQAPIPVMEKTQPIALCLLEKKDQGIYLTAIFELLRTRQNDFLEDIKVGLVECTTSANIKYFDAADAKSMSSVGVQLCKAAQVVCFDEQWANDVVSELGMSNPAYGKGTQVEYDDYHIEIEMQRTLLQGKAFLEGDYVEFPYQQESFQRHATLISDVVERVAQEALPTEVLSSINRELTAEGLGAGQLLVTLELCLGFLHRTNANPSELLREYCTRWLGSNAHPILSKGVFDGIEVRHVVSLYEGLEGLASSSVEDLVSLSYRADLDAATWADLMQCFVVKEAGWSCNVGAASGSKGKLGPDAFRDVLKRFMFRYLTTETFKPDDGLWVYLTDERLVAWPVDGGGEGAGEALEDIFPSSFQLKHARALYLALKQMCS